MKYIRDNDADGVLDRLLKAEMGRASRTGAPCSQFDPDLSAAYVERNLTPGETSRYEVHLSLCPNCRIQVANLARAGYQATLEARSETAFSPSVPRVLPGTGPSLSRVWAYLLQPQWIAVGTAALVLLVAVPIFVILKGAKRQQSPGQVAATVSSAPESSFGSPFDSAGRAQPPVSTATSSSEQSESVAEGRRTEATTSAGNPASGGDVTGVTATNGSTGLAPADARPPDSPSSNPAPEKDTASQRNEAESRQSSAGKVSESTQIAQNGPSQNQRNFQQNNADQVRVAAGDAGVVQQKQEAAEPAASASLDDKESGKGAARAAGADQISARDAQTLPDDNSKKAAPVTLKPGGVSPDGPRAKERAQTIRPKDSEPPKTETARDEPDRRTIASGPGREFATRGRNDADSVRKQPGSPPLARGQKLERRVENKRFRLQAGIWTDRDFKPAKEIPAVTLVRDGDLYKSALEKQPGLKAFLAGFGPDERVIVVYKNIIYKIFPPKD